MRTRALMTWIVAGAIGMTPATAACRAEVDAPVIEDDGTVTPTPDETETETPDDDETTVEGEVEIEDD